ncbi:Regulator of nonsense transcripts upf2 [Blomia tropicalis]|nr:Regulator of nonsense transcripts upf2 [Blomia tropicalis]
MLQTLQNFASTVSSTANTLLSQHHWQNVASKVSTTSVSETKSIEDLPLITLAEVSEHWMPNDCWIVVFDRVYDVTDFLDEHPGGQYIMLEHAGRDATLVFRGSRHGRDAYDMLDKYLIGILPEHERLYLGPDMWLER